MKTQPDITAPQESSSRKIPRNSLSACMPTSAELALAASVALAANGCLAASPTHPADTLEPNKPKPACVYQSAGTKIEGVWVLCTDDLKFPGASLGDTRAFVGEIYDKTFAADLCAPLTKGKTFYRQFPGSRTAFSVACLAFDESDKQLHQGEGCGGVELSLFFPSRAFGTEITQWWAIEPRFNQKDIVSPFFVDGNEKTNGVFTVDFRHPNSQRCGFHAVVYNGFGIRLE